MAMNPVPVDFSRRVVCILGLPFDMVDLAQAVASVRQAGQERRPWFISTANLNFVVAARSNQAFRQSVLHSQLSLADGMPIVWISRLLGLPIPERVPGAGLFESLNKSPDRPALKVYFFGGDDGLAQQAADRLNAKQGGLCCVGSQSPGFGSVDDISRDELLDDINRCQPDFLVVALGAQKGQAWIEHNRSLLEAPVISHLGAVVGFAAGAIRRAPRQLQHLGLEWLWRIKEEPKLWRRYAHDATALAGLMLHSVLPLFWQRVLSFSPRPTMAPTISTVQHLGAMTIRIAGHCTLENCQELRVSFAKAAESKGHVSLDLSQTLSLDAGVFGLLLLLSGYQHDIGQTLRLQGLSPALARLFRLHCAEQLLDEGLVDDRTDQLTHVDLA
jgi:N-acetylglucosaminyldiphosphoundecaprenol N-acetyl-beta-D-mannosaminyltransferase